MSKTCTKCGATGVPFVPDRSICKECRAGQQRVYRERASQRRQETEAARRQRVIAWAAPTMGP